MELERDRKVALGDEDARGIHDIPDDLLRPILLRLDSPIWVLRAACACKRWRGIVINGDEGRGFLRLASSLHPPTVVGQYHNKNIGDNHFVPSSSSSPIADNSRFSVDFLVKNLRWHVADCLGGLVLLRKGYGSFLRSVSDLIVYDPLTRQHRLIAGPPPPNKTDLQAASAERVDLHLITRGIRIDTFLLHGDDGNISISNFRVMCRLNATAAAGPQTCVFSTAGEGWNWRFLSGSGDDEDIFRHCYGYMADRANDGSLYLVLLMDRGLGSRMITIDNTSLVFSTVDLSIHQLGLLSSTFTVVHGPGVHGPSSSPRTSIVFLRRDTT